MFKAATSGPAKVVTANRLDSGLVVFLDPNGGWALDIAEARILDDEELDDALAYGKEQDDARIILDAYAIDVEVTDGLAVPVRLRKGMLSGELHLLRRGSGQRTKSSPSSVGLEARISSKSATPSPFWSPEMIFPK